jgi:hypothetical protein
LKECFPRGDPSERSRRSPWGPLRREPVSLEPVQDEPVFAWDPPGEPISPGTALGKPFPPGTLRRSNPSPPGTPLGKTASPSDPLGRNHLRLVPSGEKPSLQGPLSRRTRLAPWTSEEPASCDPSGETASPWAPASRTRLPQGPLRGETISSWDPSGENRVYVEPLSFQQEDIPQMVQSNSCCCCCRGRSGSSTFSGAGGGVGELVMRPPADALARTRACARWRRVPPLLLAIRESPGHSAAAAPPPRKCLADAPDRCRTAATVASAWL